MERGIATSTKPENSSTGKTDPAGKTGQPPSHLVVWLWIQGRRVVIFVIGSTVVLIGIAMIVLPGPAFIVIPLGLAILATEFLWAKKWLVYAQDHLKNLATQIAKTSTVSPQPPAAKQSRQGTAPGYPSRLPVEEADADWSRPLPGYAPPEFTSPKVFQNVGVWADPADITQVTRKLLTRTPSGDLPVSLDPHGFPLNPLGRTGLRGRGLLGKWGRNQAGDPLVTRFDPVSTDRLEFSITAQTTGARTAQNATFVIAGAGSGRVLPTVLHVWRTTESAPFVQLPDVIVAADGSFSLALDPGAFYSVTTTTGQGTPAPSAPIPTSSPFPFPYSDSFNSYATTGASYRICITL